MTSIHLSVRDIPVEMEFVASEGVAQTRVEPNRQRPSVTGRRASESTGLVTRRFSPRDLMYGNGGL